jgi:hypothetical protein
MVDQSSGPRDCKCWQYLQQHRDKRKRGAGTMEGFVKTDGAPSYVTHSGVRWPEKIDFQNGNHFSRHSCQYV